MLSILNYLMKKMQHNVVSNMNCPRPNIDDDQGPTRTQNLWPPAHHSLATELPLRIIIYHVPMSDNQKQHAAAPCI